MRPHGPARCRSCRHDLPLDALRLAPLRSFGRELFKPCSGGVGLNTPPYAPGDRNVPISRPRAWRALTRSQIAEHIVGCSQRTRAPQRGRSTNRGPQRIKGDVYRVLTLSSCRCCSGCRGCRSAHKNSCPRSSPLLIWISGAGRSAKGIGRALMMPHGSTEVRNASASAVSALPTWPQSRRGKDALAADCPLSALLLTQDVIVDEAEHDDGSR